MFSSRLLLSLFVSGVVVSSARAAETPSFNRSAEKLQAATITVRVGASAVPAKGEVAKADPAKVELSKVAPRVAVFSGVSLGNGLAVAPLAAASGTRIRITLPGGEQTEAKARVVDEYSGLALLALDKQSMPGLELADGLPEVGSWVLSAAAWGVQRPLVSLGIVSGTDRTLLGASFPPLLQADLRTAETSSGAGLIDEHGKLLGVVVAADAPDERRGWTYAVPTSHIRRLLRAKAEKPDAKSVIVLQRRRPSVGMVMETDAEKVVVKRVEKNSPAERAGIKVGDQIISADGVNIRSAYQAVQPVLVRQPGDTLTYVVEQKEGRKTIEVVLGGGIELPAASAEGIGGFVRPKFDIELVGPGVARSKTAGGQVRELYAPGSVPEPRAGEAGQPTMAESLRLLERALDGYRRVIEIQQSRLSKQDEERAATEKQLEALKAKVESLQRQIDQMKK
jgi:S1-C subfamily serine protease